MIFSHENIINILTIDIIKNFNVHILVLVLASNCVVSCTGGI